MKAKTINENMSEKANIKLSVYSGDVYTHYHSFLELVYVLEGSALHIFNETQKQIISKGDYFIIDYKTNHSYKSIDSSKFTVINCLFLPSFMDRSLTYCKDFQTLLRHYMLRINNGHSKIHLTDRIFKDEYEKILTILNLMLEEYNDKKLGYLEILRLKLIEILVMTARKVSDCDNEDIISKIIKKMYKEYNQNLSLGSCAKKFNYSLPYISKLFKEKTGMNFRDYLKKIRMDEACRLLVNTDEKIQSIANSVGYSDVDFFSKIFKENTGTTPGAFRKKI